MKTIVSMIAASLLLGAPVWAQESPRAPERPKADATRGTTPPGLRKQGKTPPGLKKQGKTPPGWSHGEKTGWGDHGSQAGGGHGRR